MRIVSCVVGRQHAEPEAHERVAAVRDLAAHLFERQRREIFLGAQRVQRFAHVERGIEQRAVEIEQHAADGRVIARSRPVASGA